MKFIIIGILITNIYSQCDTLDELNCNHPMYGEGCEWIEYIEIGNCSVFDNSESSCTNYTGECYWDEDITYSSCNGYDNNQWACNNAQGCYWDCSDYGWYCGCNGQEITGIDTECIGQYEIDNSYCQEAEMPECSEMNELECSSDNSCNWVDNIEIGSCSSLSASECSQYFDDGCSLNADCIQWGSWYSWICYEYGPSYCTGGNINIGNSYCEETEYQLGDLNQDSIINIQDVIIIINFILNGEFDLVADINLDSIVNVLDVIQIVNIILSN